MLNAIWVVLSSAEFFVGVVVGIVIAPIVKALFMKLLNKVTG